MSVQNIEAFYKEVLKNPALANGLDAAADAGSYARIAVGLGKSAGFEFSEQEAHDWLSKRVAAEAAGELADEELEAVAGGKQEPVAAGFGGGGRRNKLRLPG